MQLTKKEAKYRKKLFAETHMKKEQQKEIDNIVLKNPLISYKGYYLINVRQRAIMKSLEVIKKFAQYVLNDE